VTQEIPQETTASADPIAEIKADIAAYESIFAELTRAMDPAALLKVLTYLVRNAKRDASENQTFDTLEHRRLVARVDALMAQVQPEARKQAISQRNEQNHQRKLKAKHQADSKRQREGKRCTSAASRQDRNGPLPVPHGKELLRHTAGPDRAPDRRRLLA